MITLKQVAAQANVSQATASLVLNGRAEELKISDSCAERVRDAARLLGYQGNYHARTLSTGQTLTLGLVFSGVNGSVSHRLFGQLVAGVSDAARDIGYNLLLINPVSFYESHAHAVSFLETRRVDALIVIGRLSEQPETSPNKPLPIVYLNAPLVDGFPVVNLDPAPGIFEAVAHLATGGHQDILWIGQAWDGLNMYPERTAAFHQACSASGVLGRELLTNLKIEYSSHLEDHIARFRQALTDDLVLAPSTTAILCVNDLMGLALYSKLAERGLKIPADLSVIGFDDLHAAHAIPSMTTISHMLREMGATAVSVALQRLSYTDTDTAISSNDIRVPSRLIVRQSTKNISA